MVRFIPKFTKITLHFIYVILISYFVTRRSFKNVTIKRVERFYPDLKHILIWTKIHGIREEGQKHFINKKCHFINCYVTTNKSLFNDTRYFDVVLFNLQDVSKDEGGWPRVRSSSQKYIFAANDSSDNYPICNPVYDNFFNWTWTYRTDSTITYRFITIYNKNSDELGTHFQWIKNMRPIDVMLKNHLSSKTKAATIFLDLCKSKSGREVYVKNLQAELVKYNLTLDIFGECGEQKCKRRTMTPCYWRLKKYYYFYLALEDSFATDYLTNIVVHAYKNNAVPVVSGGAAYDKFLPPNSYLNANKMSVSELAIAMGSIIKNKTIYYNFFKWKNHYVIKEAPVLDACALCNSLNNPGWLNKKVRYMNFRQWWNPLYDQRCDVSSKLLGF